MCARPLSLFLLATSLGLVSATSQQTPAVPQQLSSPLGSAPLPQFAILKQPFKINIVYGTTIIPAGTKLPVVSIASTNVQVRYMGAVQSIPIALVQLVGTSPNQQSPSPSPMVTASPKENAVQPPPAAPTPQITLALSPGWDTRMQGGEITASELQSLLSRHCTPAVDLSGYGIDIYNGVRYLMEGESSCQNPRR